MNSGLNPHAKLDDERRPECPLFLDVKAFAAASGLPTGMVDRLLRQGRLEYKAEGRLRLIPRSELARLSGVIGR